jgi:hypothetical protein
MNRNFILNNIMKAIFLSLTLVCAFSLFAQDKKLEKKIKKEFILQVDTLNQFLEAYDSISPFSDLEEYDIIDSLEPQITRRLFHVLNHPMMKYYQVDELIVNKGMSLQKSPDNKLFFFAVDEKTGGTYRPYYSVLYYHLNDSIYGVRELGESYFACLDILDADPPKYVVSSQLYTCQTCVEESMMTFYFEDHELMITDFYNYSGRFDNSSQYDKATHTFQFQELTPHPEDAVYDTGETIDVRYRTEGRMQYLNGQFIVTESCEYLVTE